MPGNFLLRISQCIEARLDFLICSYGLLIFDMLTSTEITDPLPYCHGGHLCPLHNALMFSCHHKSLCAHKGMCVLQQAPAAVIIPNNAKTTYVSSNDLV
jgi:hypothetical protein